MYETDLAFCASYEDGQAPIESYTERMKHTQATSHGLPSDKRDAQL